jgi:Xaa-Pro aminopeptidase
MLEQVQAFDRVSKEELLKRIDGLKGLMAKEGIDFGVVFENVDKYYFTGTIQKSLLVIPVAGDPLFFVEKSVERAAMESPLDIIPIKSDKEIHQILHDRGLLDGTAGLELDVLPVSTFERLKRVVGFDRYADLAPLMRELRMIKSPFELTQIRKSGRMASHVFEAAKHVVREGVRELDIEAALVAEGRRLGHQGVLRMRGINREMNDMTVQSGFTGAIISYADVPIAGAGLTPAVPLGPTLKRVERGIPVTIDYGGGYNGYVTDETRVFVVGELKERFIKPYECALEIMEDAMAHVREGVDTTDVFARAYRIVEKAGLQDYFMGHGDGQVSFIGHGIGLEINELPVITARYKRVLREGMVFAFEPKFVFPGEGAVGIEVDFIVREEGVERVTADPLEIVCIP